MSNAESGAHVRSKITGKALSVFGVAFSFLAMLVSGGVLYFAPKGKISNAIDWQVRFCRKVSYCINACRRGTQLSCEGGELLEG